MNVSLDVSVPGSPSLIVHFGMRWGGAGRWSIHPCHTSFPLRRVMQEALSTGRVYGFDSVEAEHGDGQAESRDPEALSSAYTSEPFTSLSTSTRGFSPRARHWGAYHYLQQRISFMNARTPKPDVPYQSRRTRKVLRSRASNVVIFIANYATPCLSRRPTLTLTQSPMSQITLSCSGSQKIDVLPSSLAVPPRPLALPDAAQSRDEPLYICGADCDNISAYSG